MSGEIKNAISEAASHPKVTLAVTAAFTSNVWLDYGLPVVQGITTIGGMVVVVALAGGRILDFLEKLDKRRSKNNQ